jgi:hypothetical protein
MQNAEYEINQGSSDRNDSFICSLRFGSEYKQDAETGVPDADPAIS